MPQAGCGSVDRTKPCGAKYFDRVAPACLTKERTAFSRVQTAAGSPGRCAAATTPADTFGFCHELGGNDAPAPRPYLVERIRMSVGSIRRSRRGCPADRELR